MEGDVIVMQDIFRYVQTGIKDGRVQGYFTGTGIRPKFMDKIEACGIYLSPAMFAPARKRREEHGDRWTGGQGYAWTGHGNRGQA